MERRRFFKQAGALACSPLWPVGAVTAVEAAERPSMDPAYDAEREPTCVSVIGAGGLGTRLVARLAEITYEGESDGVQISYFGVDTDPRSLDHLATTRVQAVLLGSGTGGSCIRSSTARRVARQHSFALGRCKPDICAALGLRKASLAIVVSGFGRGAGTGLAQEIAREARRQGVFAAAFVTKPLSSDMTEQALASELRLLAMGADTVITVPHDESNPDASMVEVLAQCENELVRRVRSLLTALYDRDCSFHNAFDLNDVVSLFHGSGIAGHRVGYGDASSGVECPGRVAVRNAVQSIHGIGPEHGLILLLSGSTETLGMPQFANGIRELTNFLGAEPNATFTVNGVWDDDTLPAGRIRAELWIAGWDNT